MNIYDIIIIGAGPAGLTAALYASRARLKTLVMESTSCVSQAATASHIENYPGFEKISGFDLVEKLKKQAVNFGAEFRQDEVISVKKSSGNAWAVNTSSGNIEALSLIVASGARPKKLDIPGEEEFRGKGVSYCATCDGAFFRDKNIVVVGGGNTAVEEAIFLTKFGKKVTIIHRRDRLRATKIIQERALANKKIEFVWNSVVKEILGKQKVEAIKTEDINDKKTKEIPCDGVFMLIGYAPNTDFLKGTLSINNSGYILTDENMKTSKEGIFAAGDARKKLLLQIITACGEGATAATSARLYVEELKGTTYK